MRRIGSPNTENYSYDALQRLTTATRILGGAVTYSYSPSGNILSKRKSQGQVLYSYIA